MDKSIKTAIAIILAGLITGGAIIISKNGNSSLPEQNQQQKNIQNVSIEDGKQIIVINARGGYSPRLSVAKAGIPTIIRFNTSNTFDCSASIRIPSLNISEILPNSGATDIDLGAQKAGTLQGSCGMGMYPFEIQFKE